MPNHCVHHVPYLIMLLTIALFGSSARARGFSARTYAVTCLHCRVNPLRRGGCCHVSAQDASTTRYLLVSALVAHFSIPASGLESEVCSAICAVPMRAHEQTIPHDKALVELGSGPQACPCMAKQLSSQFDRHLQRN